MFSKLLGKISGVVLFCLAVGTTASAQYGGGTAGMPGTTGTGNMAAPGSSNYSYGNGKAIGIGVGAAAGAAVGIALYMHHRHVKANEAAVQGVQSTKSEASIMGCTQSSLTGVTLRNENDNLTYTILSSGSTKVQPGQRVELQGAVLNQKSGVNAFSVHQLVDNYGACGSSAVVAQKTSDDKGILATRLN